MIKISINFGGKKLNLGTKNSPPDSLFYNLHYRAIKLNPFSYSYGKYVSYEASNYDYV